jgi:hypothetical protein
MAAMPATYRKRLTRRATGDEFDSGILGPIDGTNIFVMYRPVGYVLNFALLIMKDISDRMTIPLDHSQRIKPGTGKAHRKAATSSKKLDAGPQPTLPASSAASVRVGPLYDV